MDRQRSLPVVNTETEHQSLRRLLWPNPDHPSGSKWLKPSGSTSTHPKHFASESDFWLRFRKQIGTFININAKPLIVVLVYFFVKREYLPLASKVFIILVDCVFSLSIFQNKIKKTSLTSEIDRNIRLFPTPISDQSIPEVSAWTWLSPPVSDWNSLIYIDGLVQDCSYSIANALELLHSCAKPSIYTRMAMPNKQPLWHRHNLGLLYSYEPYCQNLVSACRHELIIWTSIYHAGSPVPWH